MQTLSIGPAYSSAYSFIKSPTSEALIANVFWLIILYPSLVFLLNKKSHFLGTRQEKFPSFLSKLKVGFAWDKFSRSWLSYRNNSKRNSPLAPNLTTLDSRKTIQYKQKLCNCQEWNPGFTEEKETSAIDFSEAKFSFQVIWIHVSQLVAQV